MGKTDLPRMEAAGIFAETDEALENQWVEWGSTIIGHMNLIIWVFPSMCYLIAGWFIMDNPIKVETSIL